MVQPLLYLFVINILMNALISAIKDKQKIMLANEGRLLKKSFFGLLILALAFQTGEFGNVVRESMVDAYLAVSVFVGLVVSSSSADLDIKVAAAAG